MPAFYQALPDHVDPPFHDQAPGTVMGTPPYATYVVRLLLSDDRRIRGTRVTHIQTQTEEVWPGWDGARLLDFIIHHTDAREPD